MRNLNPFFHQTAQTASFAFREYIRPLVAMVRFLTSRHSPGDRAKSTPEGQTSLDKGPILLQDRLAKEDTRKQSS